MMLFLRLRTCLSRLVVVCGILVGIAHGSVAVQSSPRDSDNLLRRHLIPESAQRPERPRKLDSSLTSPTGSVGYAITLDVDNDPVLLKVNLSTGESTELGTIEVPRDSPFTGLSYSQCNDRLYAVLNNAKEGKSFIFDIDVTTTPLEAAVAFEIPRLVFRFLASDPSSDDCPQLYVGAEDVVYDLNGHGVATVTGGTAGADFDCVGDLLWGVDPSGKLYTTDLATNAIEVVGSTSIPTYRRVTGVSFDCCSQKLYAVAVDMYLRRTFFYEINTDNGVATPIGDGFAGSRQVSGLAIVPACPHDSESDSESNSNSDSSSDESDSNHRHRRHSPSDTD